MLRRIRLAGLDIDAMTAVEVVAHVKNARDGGWIVTPNVDILRQAAKDGVLRAELSRADLVLADGLPLIWAAKLAGTPLPERVAGSDLIWWLSEKCGKSVYLIGGNPDGGAGRAADRLRARGARVVGAVSPSYGFDRKPDEFEALRRDLRETKPELVFVGIGFPRQERVIQRLRGDLPGAWFMGCGAAINFVAGDQARANGFLQRTGLEWAHRLVSEPRRLAERYLRHDAPFAARLLLSAATRRR
jgi:N-acetylglucosaminyldiphosphoundecaprenol N-acetyl-beta-D-mannosaminyltransferase